MPVIGIDEVGRGALVGPVYVCGVRMHESFPKKCYHQESDGWFEDHSEYMLIRDSKYLSEKKRDEVHAFLTSQVSTQYSCLHGSNRVIDSFGISVVIMHLVALIIHGLYEENDLLLLDGTMKHPEMLDKNLLQNLIIENEMSVSVTDVQTSWNNSKAFVQNCIKGDDMYLSIAAASTIAKVERDVKMIEFHHQHKQFSWNTNKGYGSKKHRDALAAEDELPAIARKTFIHF